MGLPEHARKARRSSRPFKMRLPRVAELVTDLGLAGQNPSPDRALVREFDDTLKAFTDKFLAKKNLQRIELTQWSVSFNQDIFRQLATSFLNEGGRGSYFWPDTPSPANKKGYCFSKDRKKICDLLMPLAFRRNQILMNNQKHRINPAYPVTLPTTTPTNAIQQETVQQQTTNSETTVSHVLRPSHIPPDQGSSLESPIDVDGLSDFDPFDEPSDDEGPRTLKYLRDPGFPSPELSAAPMAPLRARVVDEIDDYDLGTPKRVLRERTHTMAPEEMDAVPGQDPYDVPNSPETVAPPINQGEKRPAETELEDLDRRTKSPRLEQGHVTSATEPFGADDDEPPHSPVPQDTNNHTSGGETRQAQLYNYVLPDGLSHIDGLLGFMSHQGSPELGEDAHREVLARRSAALDPPAKAPLALMSAVPASESEAETVPSRKQLEMTPSEDVPLDEPPKAQAHLREETPQDNASTAQLETVDGTQGKPRSQPSHSEEREQSVPVIKGKQQLEEPQVEDTLPNRDATSNPDPTFAFTVYQTEMRPVVWNYLEHDFFKGSLRELVDELPIEDKKSLKGLCISLMGKRPDQYQVFLYNEVKFRNVKNIYLTTIKEEMQEAKLDGSRLDYELIIRAIR
ncbi:hypothetical protein CEP51_001566 [Fusarium floridanum]|uniref:Uncharacterized protein n=1 Tax=Fusarium floridanum TaxID=1325733 RepID=A0A428SGB3_9HYPO|nr:hypothetical protein CEP51_001566 [Fusarium floridanum]